MKTLPRYNGQVPIKDMVMNKRNQSNHNMDVLSPSSHLHSSAIINSKRLFQIEVCNCCKILSSSSGVDIKGHLQWNILWFACDPLEVERTSICCGRNSWPRQDNDLMNCGQKSMISNWGHGYQEKARLELITKSRNKTWVQLVFLVSNTTPVNAQTIDCYIAPLV